MARRREMHDQAHYDAIAHDLMNPSGPSEPVREAKDPNRPKAVPLTPETKAAFKVAGERKMATNPNIDVIRSSPQVQKWADQSAASFERAKKSPALYDRGLRYYGEEAEKTRAIGDAFLKRAREEGHPHGNFMEGHPDAGLHAGLILQAGYSQNNSEKGRHRMVAESVRTGQVQAHISTGHIRNALGNGTPANEAFGKLKLRDYAGSLMHPDSYSGDGEGLGYVEDRHQHDVHVGQKYGDNDRGMQNVTRYRAHQAADHIAHQALAPHISVPQFQSVVWGGHRGTYD